MTQLLAVDGLPYRVLGVWAGLIRASLLWLLFSLPLITLPAATVVLLRTAERISAGRPAPGLAESWQLLRRSFWPALRLAGLIGLGSAVVASALVGPSPGGAFDAVLPLVAIPAAVTWVLVCQWPFVLLETHAGALAALRSAYLRAIRRPDLAAASALGALALPAVGLLLPSAIWLVYWLPVPAAWAVLTTATCPADAHREEGVPHEDQRNRSRDSGPAGRRDAHRVRR